MQIDCLLLIQWGKDGWLSALREQPSAPRRNLSGAMCIPAPRGGFPKESDQLSPFTHPNSEDFNWRRWDFPGAAMIEHRSLTTFLNQIELGRGWSGRDGVARGESEGMGPH